MRKAAKVILITGVICVLAGAALFLVGKAGGGVSAAREMALNGELSFGNENWVRNHIRQNYKMEYIYEDGDSQEYYDDDIDVADFDDEYEIYSGNVSKKIDSSKINKVKMEVGGGEIYVSTGTADSVEIAAENAKEFQCYVKNNILYLKGFNGWKNIKKGQNRISIVIPETVQIEETEISLGAGYMELNDGKFGKVEIELGAGEVDSNNIYAEKLNVYVGAGAAYFYNAEVGELDVNNSLGETVFEGKINGDADLECSMGSIEIVVEGNEEDFNYDLEAAAGSVEIGKNTKGVNVLGAERSINNGADKNMSAECAMGNISVSFK